MPREVIIPTCCPTKKHWAKGYCRDCYNKIKRAEYRENPEFCKRSVERARKRRANNPEKAKELSYSSHTKVRYGLSFDDYKTKLEQQGFVCALCQQPSRIKSRLAVDHNHDTGQIRSLLCHHCNTGLGAFSESPELLRKAANYLESYD